MAGEVKAAAAERWVAAVNADALFGTWRYAMVRKLATRRACSTRRLASAHNVSDESCGWSQSAYAPRGGSPFSPALASRQPVAFRRSAVRVPHQAASPAAAVAARSADRRSKFAG